MLVEVPAIQRNRSAGPCPAYPGQPPVEPHALAGQRTQVDVPAAVAPGDVMVHPEAHRVRVGELADRLAVVPRRVQPGHHVAAAVEPGHPGGAAHREMDPTGGQVQILGDLATRLAGADHQHLPRKDFA